MRTEAENYGIRLLAAQKRTMNPSDLAVQAMMIRSARDENERSEIIRIILEERAIWKVWIQETQRKWQANCSRRVVRNNHHDSWATREAYVRCSGSYHDHMGYSKSIWNAYYGGRTSRKQYQERIAA